MSPLAAFVLGLLVGWVVEWIIDWIYWRRRTADSARQVEQLREEAKATEARNADLEHQLMLQKVNLVNLQEKLAAAETELETARAAEVAPAAAQAESAPTRAAQVVSAEPPAYEPSVSFAVPVVERDDLEVIKGIGPVIAGKLYKAGICTFADLAGLTPARLRELVGDIISRLAEEDSIIEQAKQLAAKKRGG